MQALVERGRSVRALVRRRDHRADAPRRARADVVVGDFADYGSLRTALEGVSAAYLCHPVAEGIAEATSLFAAARGLRRVVHMSVD